VITPAFQKEQIRKLAEDVQKKILESEKFLEAAEGTIVIKATPRGRGFEFRLNGTV
jgi:hypothetical protein